MQNKSAKYGANPLAQWHLVNSTYMSAAPFRFAQSDSRIHYREAESAEASRLLNEARVDAACLSVAEYLSHGGLRLEPFGLVAREHCAEIVLVSEQPLDTLDTILLDSHSETSALLLRIILQKHYPALAAKVRFCRMPQSESASHIKGRVGALLLGEHALTERHCYRYSMDLIQSWYQETGLPFVLAVWAVADTAQGPEFTECLAQLFTDGIEKKDFFVREWADDARLSREEAVSHITACYTFELDSLALKSLTLFQRYAAELNLLPATSNLDAEACTTDSLLTRSSSGERLSISEAKRLATDAPFSTLAVAADFRRSQLCAADEVTYDVGGTVFYTNICAQRGGHTGFFVAPGQPGGFLLPKAEILQRVEEIVNAGGSDIIIQGGLHPELTISYFEDLFSSIKACHPVSLSSLSAGEILHIARISQLSVETTLKRLIFSGLSALPETGGSILVESYRKPLHGVTTSADEWLNLHRIAHRLGLTSTAEIIIGLGESWSERIYHLHQLRTLQDETHGFLSFVVNLHHDIPASSNRAGYWEMDLLRTQAIARLFLDNIPNIQNLWRNTDFGLGHIQLQFGANDCQWRVVDRDALLSPRGHMHAATPEMIERQIRKIGFHPVRRNGRFQRIAA